LSIAAAEETSIACSSVSPPLRNAFSTSGSFFISSTAPSIWAAWPTVHLDLAAV
jgi:hypothetical protein